MKKLFILLAFALGTFWFSAFWMKWVCIIGDIESLCLCKVNGQNRNTPVDQEAYNSCIAEEKAKRTQKTPEEKQAETVVEKVEKVVEKKMTQEEAQAYAELKEKSAVIDGLFEVIETKDKATQEQIKSVVEVFKKSGDQYTKNIGFYLGYLMR